MGDLVDKKELRDGYGGRRAEDRVRVTLNDIQANINEMKVTYAETKIRQLILDRDVRDLGDRMDQVTTTMSKEMSERLLSLTTEVHDYMQKESRQKQHILFSFIGIIITGIITALVNWGLAN